MKSFLYRAARERKLPRPRLPKIPPRPVARLQPVQGVA